MAQGDLGGSLISGRAGTARENIRRAFELAYFIHANTDIALRVVEEAWCKLEHTFGKQDRRFYYVPSGRKQSQGRSSHALRTKVSLREAHLLQLLIYAESEPWERYAEYGHSPYPLTDEDMVIRFIKHLVQVTLKRNSFYVSVGIGRVLYDYQTSEVRQIYDVLMQDHARFRDNSYLRKQKKALMKEIIGRFQGMVRIGKVAQRELRFLTQPTTQQSIELVNECLRRFTPWDTSCAVPEGFDPAEGVSAFSFSGADPDSESPIEMNRIHAILHPDCFSRLVSSLRFDSPETRLTVPQFFYSEDDTPRGDRFAPPTLTEEHYLHLGRTQEDRARRRKAYLPGQLRVSVDGVEITSFEPDRFPRVSFKIPATANVIEVRGQDAFGELPLATVLVSYPDIPPGGSLKDSVVLEGGQKLAIVFEPIENASGEIKEAGVELRYGETQPIRATSLLARRAWLGLVDITKGRREGSAGFTPGYSWLAKTGVSVALVLSLLAIVWYQLRPTQTTLPVPTQVELPTTPDAGSPSPIHPAPEPPGGRRSPTTQPVHIANTTWDKDPQAVDRAIRIGERRGSAPSVDISGPQTKLLFALPQVDAADQKYLRYRITIEAAEKPIWERTLQHPGAGASRRRPVLNVEFSPVDFPKADSYRMRFEGETQSGWQAIGQVSLRLVSR